MLAKYFVSIFMAGAIAASSPFAANAGSKRKIVGGIAGALIIGCAVTRCLKKGSKRRIKKSVRKSPRRKIVKTKRSPRTSHKKETRRARSHTRTGRKGVATTSTPRDAVRLSARLREDLQRGLKAVGFYDSTIDGGFGRGTRLAIQRYQSSVSTRATGYLTRRQITALLRRSPRFATLGASDPRLFEIEFVEDATPRETRIIQTELNRRGFESGTPDGRSGPGTRSAIRRFMVAESLPGDALVSKRLYSFLMKSVTRTTAAGGTILAIKTDEPSKASLSVESLLDEPGPQAESPLDGGLAEIAEASKMPLNGSTKVAGISAKAFAILGARIGDSRELAIEKVARSLKTSTNINSTSDAWSLSDVDVMASGSLITLKDKAGEGSDEILIAAGGKDSKGTANAIFRRMKLPEGIERDAVFGRLKEKFGPGHQDGDNLIWISDELAQAEVNNGTLSWKQCGDLRVNGWNIGAPESTLDSADGAKIVLNEPVKRRCGSVLRATMGSGSMSFALWNGDLLMDHGSAATEDREVDALKF